MPKLTLIGDSAVSHYATVERLWELISAISNVRFSFELRQLASSEEVAQFLDTCRHDRACKGVIVATVWRASAAKLVGRLENPATDAPGIDTIYPSKQGGLIGANILPVAIQKT